MRGIEYILFSIAYLLIPVLPVFFYLQTTINDHSILIIISRVAGIYTFVWYSLQFVITARLKALERISGQDRLLILHMMAAVGALIFTAVHTSFGDDDRADALQKWFGGAGDNVFLYSVIFSAVFFSNYFIRLVPRLISYRNILAKKIGITYEKCIWAHHLMPVGMCFALVHVLLLPGADLIPFKVTMATIAGIGLVAYGWHKCIIPWLIRRSPWKISQVIQKSDLITSLVLESTNGKKLRHHPGQFCYICPLNDGLPKQKHPFTISSAPEDSNPHITFKSLGDFTEKLKTI